VLACVPTDPVAVDPRETAAQAPAAVTVPARRAVARLDPVTRSTVRGTVFLRETPAAVVVEILVASVEPGTYRAVVRDGADCARPAATAVWGSGSGPSRGDLGEFEVGADGAGRLAKTAENLGLERGPAGIVGKIVTIAPSGQEAEPVACGVIEAER
jgi:Cu-Zn family superoxide dismutase